MLISKQWFYDTAERCLRTIGAVIPSFLLEHVVAQGARVLLVGHVWAQSVEYGLGSAAFALIYCIWARWHGTPGTASFLRFVHYRGPQGIAAQWRGRMSRAWGRARAWLMVGAHHE